MDILILSAIAVAVVLGGAMLLVLRTRGWAPAWSARAESDVEVPLGRSEALASAVAAVSTLRLLGDPEVDGWQGTVEAKCLGLWRTLADLVSIELTEIDPSRTRVRIRSRPVLPQAIDYGASRARVDQVRRLITASGGSASGEGPARDTRRRGRAVGRLLLVLAGAAVAVLVAGLALERMRDEPSAGAEGARVTVAPAGSSPTLAPFFAEGGFPHEDPGLEDLMPTSAAGRPLRVWSVRGGHDVDASINARLAQIATGVGRPASEVSMAVAGRSVETDPGNWAFAFHVDGVPGETIRSAVVEGLNAPTVGRTVGGRSVLAAGDDGLTYAYAEGDTAFVVMGVDEAAAADLLGHVALPALVLDGEECGFTITLPVSWVAITSDMVAEPAAVARLKADNPGRSALIDDVAGQVRSCGPGLVGTRLSAEDAPPWIAVTATAVDGTSQFDIDRALASIRDAYALTAIPDHRRVELPAGPAWEVRWTGTMTGDWASEFLWYLIETEGKVFEIGFSATEGELDAYADSFAQIRDSFRVVPDR